MDTVTVTDSGPPPEPGQPTVEEIDAIDARLDDVERSLARIDAGTYGRCEACGTLIDDASLTADPTAVRCSSCRPTDADARGGVSPSATTDGEADVVEDPPVTA
jgi:RNA polymerase-binding transcription factor DksA